LHDVQPRGSSEVQLVKTESESGFGRRDPIPAADLISRAEVLSFVASARLVLPAVQLARRERACKPPHPG
jgi:hypothetical protein